MPEFEDNFLGKRYVPMHGSQLGHECCFDATVVDTEQPLAHTEGLFRVVCECFDYETAVLIASRLNGE